VLKLFAPHRTLTLWQHHSPSPLTLKIEKHRCQIARFTGGPCICTSVLHPFFSFSASSTVTNLHVFLSVSCSLLLVAGGWLSYFSRWFVPLWESQKLFVGKWKMSCFYGLEKPGIFGIPNRILQGTGTGPLKSHKTETSGFHQTLFSHTQLFKEAMTCNRTTKQVLEHKPQVYRERRRLSERHNDYIRSQQTL
jgi:hypothetical protein